MFYWANAGTIKNFRDPKYSRIPHIFWFVSVTSTVDAAPPVKYLPPSMSAVEFPTVLPNAKPTDKPAPLICALHCLQRSKPYYWKLRSILSLSTRRGGNIGCVEGRGKKVKEASRALVGVIVVKRVWGRNIVNKAFPSFVKKWKGSHHSPCVPCFPQYLAPSLLQRPHGLPSTSTSPGNPRGSNATLLGIPGCQASQALPEDLTPPLNTALSPLTLCCQGTQH